MNHRITSFLLLTGLLACLTTPALAAKVKVTVAEDSARLTISGKLIAAFRTRNGSLSPEQRAERAAERLGKLIDEGLTAKQVEVRSRGEAWGVYAKGGLVMIATPEEAELRHEEPETTAKRWAANLKQVLGAGDEEPEAPKTKRGKRGRREPQLEAPESVVIPFGETRHVPIHGAGAGLKFEPQVEGIVAISPAEGKPGLSIKGIGVGKCAIRVSYGEKAVTISAQVQKYAGAAVKVPQVEVTGAMAPASLIRKAIEGQLFNGIKREPGATVHVTGSIKEIKALTPGASEVLTLPITISGPGYIPVETGAKVIVKNRPVRHEEPTTLLYSNEPESVKQLQTLYTAPVGTDGPTRFLYHHQNRLGRPFMFQVDLINPTDSPSTAQLIQGDAGPVLDTVDVGHRGAQRYWANALTETGICFTLPPHGFRTVYYTRVPQLLTVSGIYTIRVLEGSPLVVRVAASEEVTKPPVDGSIVQVAEQEEDIYPLQETPEHFSYTVGERWAFIPVGGNPIKARDKKRKLFGNYGVTFDYEIDVSNPTDVDKTIRVLLSAGAGPARGVFLVDGKLIEAPQLAPPGEFEILTFKLHPQEKRHLKLEGIPVGGSAYPAQIVVRS